ncbi:hypothetical protein HNV11_19940 [Spirosoma taeanense]|uniref:Restriction endonuclease n=1 Tax=Spirosoma taeanense TaxID=2735870 RepID=A0A6M5YBZ2_9BACT|nr:hypothetical protein [Spirosoma taeanense]QJW91489.1 hypothetical protein HNV11_19940 [Spirosoma taeanense]
MSYLKPSSIATLVREDDMGVNAPIIHQSVIARLTSGLYPLYKSGRINFEPLPEMMLTEGYSSPVPDLLLYDHQTEQAKVIIEVCQTNGLKHDTNKVIRLIDEGEYGILEGLVFNYKTQQWLCYNKGDGGMASLSSFSKILQLDLNEFL